MTKSWSVLYSNLRPPLLRLLIRSNQSWRYAPNAKADICARQALEMRQMKANKCSPRKCVFVCLLVCLHG